MCCTTAIGGMSAGSWGSTVRNASTPPVDAPMTTSCLGSTRPTPGRQSLAADAADAAARWPLGGSSREPAGAG